MNAELSVLKALNTGANMETEVLSNVTSFSLVGTNHQTTLNYIPEDSNISASC